MAQRPTNDFNIDPNITSGSDLANILNRFQDAIDSGNSGASRPAYLAAGGMWVKEGSPMRLYFYDGTKDIELYNTTDGFVGASQWKDNGNDIYYDGGNVEIKAGNLLINNANPAIQLRSTASNAYIDQSTAGATLNFRCRNQGNLLPTLMQMVEDDVILQPSLTGSVGIGMNPLRSTAKEQLAVWKARFDARLKAEPKADKKAVTLEITDDAFEVLPTEEALAEWLETRAAGDRLQVNGNGSFSGTVNAASFVRPNNAGITFTAKEFLPADAQGVAAGDVLDLGRTDIRWKDAYLSGAVNATEVDVAGDGFFTGEVHADEFLRNGIPVPTAKDLIETLSTLREATRDETTLEGLRDALSDAIGGLIQKFEAQISTTES